MSYSNFSSFYLGGYGGYGWTDAETDIAGVDDFDVNGADYGVFVGYELDRLLDPSWGISGALEIYYGWSNADDDDDVAAASIEKDHEWGINFRPGLSFLSYGSVINPYGIIGYRNTKFEVDSAAGSGDDDYDGLDLGIGTELVTWDRVGLRLDYTHTFYEDKNGIDPDEDDIRVGLSYHF
jgi:opacity protein-like surface antigen